MNKTFGQVGVVLLGLGIALAGCTKADKESSNTSPANHESAARPKPVTTTPPVAPPVTPPAKATPSCRSHKDCRVTCDVPNSCCGQLCDCTKPYHKDQLDPMRAANKKLCDESPGCPKADCAEPTTDHVPACLSGTCVAAVYPRATRCKSDSDCQLYCFDRGDCLGQTCGPCRNAFHNNDIAALEQWRAKSCDRKGPWVERAKCSRTATNTAPICEQGQCATKNIPW